MSSTLNIAGVNVGFDQAIPVSTNFVIADIREPGSRNGSFTKTIKVPGTHEVNLLFEFVFDTQIELATFNPNKITTASYYVNEALQLKGDLRILDSEVSFNNGVRLVYYNCQITGQSSDIFFAIGTKFLHEIDVSDLDHTFTYNSAYFAPTPGVGFGYGYIDYGLAAGAVSNNWRMDHLKPFIWAYEYIKRIFDDAGFTFTSTFLNSVFFKQFAIPDVNEGALQMSQTQISNAQIYVGKTSATSAGGLYSGDIAPYSYYQFFNVAPFVFNDDSTPPFNDAGGLYNTGTGVVTTLVNSTAQYTAQFNIRFTFTAPAGANVFTDMAAIVIARFTYVLGGVGSPVVYDIPINCNDIGARPVVAGTVIYDFIQNPILPPIYFPAGTTLTVSFIAGPAYTCRGTWLNVGTPVAGTGSNLAVSITTARLYSNLQNFNQLLGNTVEMNTTIPRDVRQSDFLKSIINAFNLQMEIDRENDKNYIIEPYPNFVLTSAGSIRDYTAKQDHTNPAIIKPMGELTAKTYLLTYKSDTDLLNKNYHDTYKEIYGQRKYEVDNDFIKNEKKIELIFSPTPGATFGNSQIVAPRFFKQESGTISPMRCNIRLLYYSGLQPCNTHNLTYGTSSVSMSSYPYIGHLDSPSNPGLDLCFSAPKKLYYTIMGLTYTSNNLSQRYYTKMIEEITNQDSKVMIAEFLLSALDINIFSFRNKWFVNGTYYTVNKILDYDPQVRKSCTVELLKVKDGIITPNVLPPYNPSNPPLGSGNGISVISNPLFNNNGVYSNPLSIAAGNNVIMGGAHGFLSGTNSNVLEGVEGFNGFGLDGFSVGEEYSGKTLFNNGALLISSDGLERVKQKRQTSTVTITWPENLPVLFVDATSGNIYVTMPSADGNKATYKLIRKDASGNTVTLKGALGTENFKNMAGSATSYLAPIRSTLELTTDNNDWYF